MGGLGSGRTSWTYRIFVEDCKRLPLKALNLNPAPGYAGSFFWTRGNSPAGNASYIVEGGETPTGIRLLYSIDGQQFDYVVRLTRKPTPWGAWRYYYACPACGRRCSVLYMRPRGRLFACRQCNDLVYRSQYEKQSSYDTFYRSLAGMMQADHPGMTAEDIEWAFEKDFHGKVKPPPAGGYYERLAEEIFQELLADLPDPYAGYLDRGQLCEQAGLAMEDLEQLEAARLLLPDHGGLYRPKLAGWGRKLAFLLGEGWPVETIKAWAKGRYSTADPRRWPPVREEWEGYEK